MTLETSHHGTDVNLHLRMLAASNAALAHIARGAPLAQTLTCIVNGIEEQHPDISGAIFLLDEDGNRLHLGAAPSLQGDYCRAIDGIACGAGVWAGHMAADIEAHPFWRGFRDLALEHGLYTCVTIPIWSATNCVLGIFVAYSQNPDRASDTHSQAMGDVTALASIAIQRNIDEARIKRAEHTLRESETRMALAIEGSGTGIWDRNVATGEIHYSTGWKAILGYTDAEIGNRIEDSYTRVHPDDLAAVQAAIQAHFDQETESYAVEHRIRCKNGCYKWISSRGKVVSRDKEGKPLRMIGTTTDITERKRTEIELQEFATIDFLTQLPNRRCFMERMEEELARIRRVADTRTAVLMCDLDHFKVINDSYGHAIGDQVLKHFAAILREELRKNDTVGRVGGEEFAVVLSGAGIAEANIFAKRVQKQITDTLLVQGDETISVTVSIGIAVMSVTDASADVSLSRSDMALYRAKENGRNRIEIAV